jgi:GNAT superfamily N-acetyltransferase
VPLTTSTAIRTACAEDLPVLADVLARAFQDDPVFAWSIPDPDERRARLPALFATFAEVFLPHDDTYLTEDLASVALWAPAGVDPLEGAPGAWFAQRCQELLSPDDAARCLAVGELFEQHHPSGPSAYLQLIGTVPEQQGHGRGSQLLRHALARCDEHGIAAYLEASTPANRRLYARHGFRTTGDITLPEDGPTVWPMWRDPTRP